MIKILHSADWHLDSPLHLQGREQAQYLRQQLQTIPGRIAEACREQGCDLMLLSGDLFDGPYAADTVQLVKNALENAGVPVFISPGNHDFIGPDSPWLQEQWPQNVHIFTHPVMEAVDVPELNCCVYGAGYLSMDCPGILEDFSATHTERYGIGVLHGDPTQTASPYCPITTQQVAQSELDYLALGHIHKAGSLRAGKTLCAWPGCPMGRGYDELGEKGYYIVTIDREAACTFVPLDLPRFHEISLNAQANLAALLPAAGSGDFYRVTFTGPSEPLDLEAIQKEFPLFPNLTLRDQTVPPLDIWGSSGEDTFEGTYFKLLHDALDACDPKDRKQIELAAKISRQLLNGQEVELP